MSLEQLVIHLFSSYTQVCRLLLTGRAPVRAFGTTSSHFTVHFKRQIHFTSPSNNFTSLLFSTIAPEITKKWWNAWVREKKDGDYIAFVIGQVIVRMCVADGDVVVVPGAVKGVFE